MRNWALYSFGMLVMSACLSLARPACGDFTGITVETVPNGFGLQVFDIYANFTSDADQLVVTYGNVPSPLYMEVIDGVFFQSEFSGDRAPLQATIDVFPMTAFDTFVTIGVLTGEGDQTMLTPGWPGFDASSISGDNMSWSVTPDDPQSFAVGGRVLLARFSTPDGTGVQGFGNVIVFEAGAPDDVPIMFTTVPPILGACCLSRGACMDVTSDICSSSGGVWQGPDTDCDTFECPLPTGACCLTDFTCAEIDQAACLAMGGAWQDAFSACEGVDCTPRAACCLPDGSCLTAGDLACVMAGGIYQGPETNCGTTMCPQPIDACCFQDATCLEVERAECEDLGGSYQGLGSACGMTTCPAFGACCCPKAECVFTTEQTCLEIAGRYQGDFVTCEETSCPECLADVNKDGVADHEDLVMVHMAYAMENSAGYCHGPCDLNDNGTIDIHDVLGVVGNMGGCAEPLTCVGDVDRTGTVDVNDLVIVFQHWGDCPGGCMADVNGDSLVDVMDMVTLIAAWGPCSDATAMCPDFNDDGVVDAADEQTLMEAWGPCSGPCPQDVDGNGAVDIDDLRTLVRSWGSCP